MRLGQDLPDQQPEHEQQAGMRLQAFGPRCDLCDITLGTVSLLHSCEDVTTYFRCSQYDVQAISREEVDVCFASAKKAQVPDLPRACADSEHAVLAK